MIYWLDSNQTQLVFSETCASKNCAKITLYYKNQLKTWYFIILESDLAIWCPNVPHLATNTNLKVKMLPLEHHKCVQSCFLVGFLAKLAMSSDPHMCWISITLQQCNIKCQQTDNSNCIKMHDRSWKKSAQPTNLRNKSCYVSCMCLLQKIKTYGHPSLKSKPAPHNNQYVHGWGDLKVKIRNSQINTRKFL